MNRIRILRRNAHPPLTQEELADRVGVSQAHMSRIERGVATPSIVEALRIALALNASIEAIFLDLARPDDQEPAAP